MLFYKVYYLAAAFPELNHAQSMHIQWICNFSVAQGQ
jgi:hypothetical protein